MNYNKEVESNNEVFKQNCFSPSQSSRVQVSVPTKIPVVEVKHPSPNVAWKFKKRVPAEPLNLFLDHSSILQVYKVCRLIRAPNSIKRSRGGGYSPPVFPVEIEHFTLGVA
ncbi:hypothetical protein AVEN_187961-1 [Araneus ventricosus]|uniref:Uncharacterized protein n=1 Tax=Araneus ventricosus TaxID=182803 RepID=A0A4Y2E268_ARAVE|nr:hypothetical protein AVEN_187961-1 [Araneus ventricosus]